MALSHYTLPSMMAGKVHALLVRPYPKGRDWFDLLWYRAHRPPFTPKLELLQNALDQTQGRGAVDASRWQELLRNKISDLDMEELARDVNPFLEHPADRLLLSRENILGVLEQ